MHYSMRQVLTLGVLLSFASAGCKESKTKDVSELTLFKNTPAGERAGLAGQVATLAKEISDRVGEKKDDKAARIQFTCNLMQQVSRFYNARHNTVWDPPQNVMVIRRGNIGDYTTDVDRGDNLKVLRAVTLTTSLATHTYMVYIFSEGTFTVNGSKWRGFENWCFDGTYSDFTNGQKSNTVRFRARSAS